MTTLNVSLDPVRIGRLRERARVMRARGWLCREIAAELGVSLRTVQRYTAGHGRRP